MSRAYCWEVDDKCPVAGINTRCLKYNNFTNRLPWCPLDCCSKAPKRRLKKWISRARRELIKIQNIRGMK